MNDRGGRVARLPLPTRPSAVPQARRYTRDVLTGWSERALADDAELVTAELVTNAVLYSVAPLALVLREVARGVRVEVEDGSPQLPHRGLASDDAMTGRGLFPWRQRESWRPGAPAVHRPAGPPSHPPADPLGPGDGAAGSRTH